ncbi:MAG: DNA adenine methylase [Christensenellales bacterium]|nr:DNA adenine methylase [Christensenellales bacterium]
MREKAPHLVQYQGSKRVLAPQILQYMPSHFHRLIEPFAGMAAVSIAVAQGKLTDCFLINDLNAPLLNLLQAAVETPQELLSAYSALWQQQFDYGENHVQHYYAVRDQFNSGDTSPANMLYLLARCVKGAVRYGQAGNFNQSPDKRRHGTNPITLSANLFQISDLLKGKTAFCALDYHEILNMASPSDLVYMDPPYQGVTNCRDRRYLSGVTFQDFAEAVLQLNKRGIDFLISYDGICGEKSYGQDLPPELHCKKVLLNAGISTQATLLGQKATTLEALYISESLVPLVQKTNEQLNFLEAIV